VRTLCSAVLVLEAIVLGLAIPVALTLSDLDNAVAGWGGAGLMLLCVLAAGLLGRPVGLVLGSAVQVLAVLSGIFVPAMLLVGAMFAALWVAAIRLGRKGDAARSAFDQAR
jgi:hypothetical protein